MSLEVQTEEMDGRWLVRAAGEVDLYSSPELREVILAVVHKAKTEVAVDLSAVSYMDSSGVATLVEGLKACGKKVQFAIIAPANSVLKVLQLARLDTIFSIRDAF